MYKCYSPLILCLLSFVLAANAFDFIGALDIEPRINLSALLPLGGFKTIADADRARARKLQSGRLGIHHKRQSYTAILNNGLVYYTAPVYVGANSQRFSLVVDTGSSTTWLNSSGSSRRYIKTSTSRPTNRSISVTYGTASMSGFEYLERVNLTSSLIIPNQSIGVATTSSGLFADGILGIGPTVLTTGTIAGFSGTTPTVLDNLASQNTIGRKSMGIYFSPILSNEGTGELTFGGYNASRQTSAITYTSLATVFPSNQYFGMNMSVFYGPNVRISKYNAGIVDTGTSLIMMATDVYNAYKTQTGAVLDSGTGLLSITNAQYNNLKPLLFKIGATNFTLPPNGQIWPRRLNFQIGGTVNSTYLIITDLGTNQGAGLDFILGYKFLERFYSIYDVTGKQLGFSTTKWTNNGTVN